MLLLYDKLYMYFNGACALQKNKVMEGDMSVKEPKKKKLRCIGDSNKTDFEEKLDLSESQGWKVEKVWMKEDCWFARLSKPKEDQPKHK
jgi:hypothetical protein